MAQLLSDFGADLTGLRQGASCAVREKTPFFLQPIRVYRHALIASSLTMLAASGGSHEKGRAIVVLPQFLCHGVVVLGWDEHMGGPLGGPLPHALGPRQPKP